jgi:hypothetical protein
MPFVLPSDRERSEADAAFSLLGLALERQRGAVSDDDVRRAFRRRCLEVHPDKRLQQQPQQPPQLEGDGEPQQQQQQQQRQADVGIAELVVARERALSALRADPSGVDWSVLLAHMAWSAAAAQDIVLDLDVTLDDVYHARVKKIVVSVVRRPCFTRGLQTVYVRLARARRDEKLAAARVFRGLGDDSPAAMLYGEHAPEDARRRGDIRVRVRVADHPVYAPDPVLHPCDLHADVPFGLVARYYGATVALDHFGGAPVSVTYDPLNAQDRQVCMFPGLGLPYGGDCGGRCRGRGPGSGSSQRSGDPPERGDLFVFLDLRVPWPGDSDDERRAVLADGSVRRVLEALDAAAAREGDAPACLRALAP